MFWSRYSRAVDSCSSEAGTGTAGAGAGGVAVLVVARAGLLVLARTETYKTYVQHPASCIICVSSV